MSVIDMPKSGYDLLGSQTIVETSERRIRVQFNSEYIADSTKTFLLRRGAGRLNYYFPEQDVRMKHLMIENISMYGFETRWPKARPGNYMSQPRRWLFLMGI